MALWALGFVLYAGLIVAGYPIAGVAGFAVCGVAALAYVGTRDRAMFDERDGRLLGHASANTIQLLGVVSAVVFPSMVALDALGVAAWPTWLGYFGYFVAGLFAVWVAFLLVERRR